MLDFVRAQDKHGEFHGMQMVLTNLMRELKEFKPKKLVFLQGANDAARHPLSEFSERLDALILMLKKAESEGWLSLSRIIWVTAPTRAYLLSPL